MNVIRDAVSAKPSLVDAVLDADTVGKHPCVLHPNLIDTELLVAYILNSTQLNLMIQP